MPEALHTQGEILFEQYLRSQMLPFEFEKPHAGKSKKPDYTIEWDGKAVVFDVKDFDPPESLRGGICAFDPYPRIREKIDQGRHKFKQYREFCCGLALFNLGNPFVRLDKAEIVLGAMYGDSGFTFPINTATGVGDATKVKWAFLNRGKMIRPHWSQPQNTTISALITLTVIHPHRQLLLETSRADRSRSVEECYAELQGTIEDFDPTRQVPRVIVWHNAVARIPFPDDLFCGPYDAHFGTLQDEEGFVQGVTYRGSSLPDSVKI